ncbi:response regulator transcription factor [Rasiella sp. SM2506]|uniref:response regulator transcription factor n=1 Tax=Rasiella sp. SM2506 TaxID=3423914 RepID=UPI003D7B08DD
MKSHTSLSLLKIDSEKPQAAQTYSPKKHIEVFAEKFLAYHSKIHTVSATEDNIRYLYKDTTALNKLKNIVSLYESIETNLQNKGVNTFVIASLTMQEQKIIALIAEGLQTKQIASELFISEHTVQTHRKNLYKKLNVDSVTDLVKISMMMAVN